MKYVKLGNSDLNVSRICMGCMGFGDASKGQHSWTLDEEHSREIIKRGFDLGVNFYDTAIAYQGGTSEQFVGRALRDFARREDVVVATKFLPRTPDEIENGISGQQHIENMINTSLVNLLMCDKEAIEVQKILPFLSDTWPLCRIGRAVIRASQSCRQSCNKSQCPACGCRSHHSCTHAPQFSRSFPAREWGSVLQRQGACGQCP